MPAAPTAATAQPATQPPPAVDDDHDEDDETSAATHAAEQAAASPPVAEPMPEIHPETVVRATLASLQNKPVRRDKVLVPSVDEQGRAVKLELRLVAIGTTEFDKLQDAYPPSQAHQLRGAIWNRDKFPPALLERVVVDPKLTAEEWKGLADDPNWSGGEFNDLFQRALRLCQATLDVPFTESD